MRAKKISLNIIKAIAGIAAVVFWLVPLRTGTQFLLFVASMVVMLICFAISANLDDSDTGYWPSNPEDSPLVSKIPPGAAGRATSPEQVEHPNITKPNPHG
jgi:hypothetical protein